MKFPVCLLLIIFVSLSIACSDSRSAESEEVFFDDGYKTGDREEIVIDDYSFEEKGAAAASQQRSGSQEITRIAPDGSRITTMYDGFGNKTETRFFDDNPLVQIISVRTSASGEKQVSVFAQNGEVKQLPANMLDKVLTAPANDLAAAAGIFQGRREPTIVQTSQPPLQPMPGYRFPVQTPPAQAVPIEPTEPETPEPATTETAKPPTAPKQKTDKIDSKNPSDEPD